MKSRKLFVLASLFIALSVTAQEANLTMKPVVGKKYNVEVNSAMDMTQNMAGMEMKMNVTSTGKAVMEMKNVDSNGDFTALFTWTEINAKSSAMGQDTTMNFNDLNLIMKTTYDKTGKIIKNERMDTTSNNNPAIAMAEQMATGMKLHILPAKMVKKGETWISNTNDTIQPMGSPFSMITNTKDEYVFAGTETKDGKEYYRVNVAGPTKISGEGSQMGMDMTIEGTGMNEGYSLLDKTTLLPILTEGKIGMDMNIMISGAQSMAVPVTQNMTTSITFEEVRD